MRALRIGVVVVLALAVVAGVTLFVSPRAQFVAGGALVNLGFRLQDPLEAFDLEHVHATPAQVWDEVERQNRLARSVREYFPRTPRHPLVAMLVCMDARIDTTELAGDTRRYYYVIRTAGSVLGEHEQEMLELAVENGVEVVVLTRHTDCAAERAARDPALRAKFPSLTQAVDERERRVAEFLARPAIRDRIAKGTLLVKDMVIDTATDGLLVPHEHAALQLDTHVDAH